MQPRKTRSLMFWLTMATFTRISVTGSASSGMTGRRITAFTTLTPAQAYEVTLLVLLAV